MDDLDLNFCGNSKDKNHNKIALFTVELHALEAVGGKVGDATTPT